MQDITKLNWISGEAGKYEMILDHHMLATWRMCQENFRLLHIEGRRPKKSYGWPVDFGSLFHTIIEEIYKWRAEGTFSLEKLTNEAYHMWDERNMDRYREHRTCKQLGGKMGFIALCHAYAQYYTQDSERLRIIGTEIGFGSNKEVFLGKIEVVDDNRNRIVIYCYLSGRIDFLADDGNKIGPVDHKTRATFGMNDLGATYNPHEGMTGYIFATRAILKNHFPELYAKRQVNTAWMNFIQVAHEPDPLKRFKRVLLMRTDYQLEEFRLRQLIVFEDIFRHLADNRKAAWNTEVCAHWYGSECMYRPVHRQADEQSQLIVLNSDFEKGVYWNPEYDEKGENKNGNGGAGAINITQPNHNNTEGVSGDSESDKAAVS